MTAGQRIRREIVLQAIQAKDIDAKPPETADEVEECWERMVEADIHWDYESEFREGQCETDVNAPWSRHYESRSVAHQCSDGQWVGWTYWYGGGKHGEPEAVEWMDDAYLLGCVETEKTVTVREFTVIDEVPAT